MQKIIMLKLKNNKIQKINIESLVLILFYTFPLSFIIGNAVISIHSFIFISFKMFIYYFVPIAKNLI